ncbi:uncharacterized protein C7orf50 homolog [Diachasma alloeum]|uniref:uncharacterized protein C7orf50 homolog n=1 Tax=Diachasma alloeum TaxID=454923 RepID=UPI000738135F|nr:uncharacterized protein C7orf50 homolog [Diachasma alloeum]
MGRSSNNDDGMTVDSKSEKKSKKKKTKSVADENAGELVSKPEVKVKKSKRKKSEASEAVEEDVPKKAKKAKKEKLDDTEKADKEVDEEVEGDAPPKSKKPSKRQLKREKKEAREAEKRDASKVEAMNKSLEYISTWKHAKSKWKFEKLKQIWLMDHLLDDSLVPEEVFPTVLEYFEGCKGMARELLLKKGMDVIKKYERQQEAAEEVEETVEYKRARQLLQALPTET